jgi:hypothetical protein
LGPNHKVDALAGTAWMTYYESARAEQAMTTGYYSNMLTEQKLGVAAGVHTYYKVSSVQHRNGRSNSIC